MVRLYNNGGRVLIIVEKVEHGCQEAREKALKGSIKKIESDNLFYRSDIGHWAL